MTVTYLLQKIQSKVWGEVIRHLGTENGIEEAQILHDGELCLHHALRLDPPLDAIQDLIAVYPGSVNFVGNNAMFPLHIAVKYKNKPDIVDELLRWNIDALVAKNDFGQTPLDYDYVDNGMFKRPTACWKRQNETDMYLARREKIIISMEKCMNEVERLQQKKKNDCAMLEKKYNEVSQQIKESIKETEEKFGSFMEALVSIQDDMDEFVDKVNCRINIVDEEMKSWNQRHLNGKKERDTQLSKWCADLKALQASVKGLEEETKSTVTFTF